MKIRAMQYNVFSGRDVIKYNKIKEWNNPEVFDLSLAARIISKHNPDIVSLCEVHGKGGIFTEQIEYYAKKCGYPYYFFAPAIMTVGSPYGVAFMSKYPITDAEKFMIPDPEEYVEGTSESRCIAKMTIDINGRKLDVLVSHFGLLDSEQKNAVDLAKALISEAKNRCILMGDFNCEPDSVHINELRTVLKDTAQDKTMLTMTSIEPTRKIDYIFADKSIDVLYAEALDEIASDHRPFIADLDIGNVSTLV